MTGHFTFQNEESAKLWHEANMNGYPVLPFIAKGILPKASEHHNNCILCGKESAKIVVDSKKLGVLSVRPSYCNDCRDRDFRNHLREEEIEAWNQRKERCGGHQNRPALFRGKEVLFEDIAEQYDFQKEVFSSIERVVDGEELHGMYIFGNTGTGKTFLAKTLHNELLRRYKDSCFIKAVDMALMLRKSATSWDKNSADIIQQLRRVKHLIVDDIGTQKNTEFIREAIYAIFDYRYDQKLPTVVTTNVPLDDLKEEDARLESRLSDKSWMQTIVMYGKDFRKEPFIF